MQRTLRVAGHEFLRHVRRPSFLLTTALLPIILGVVVLLTGNPAAGAAGPDAPLPTAEQVGIVDASGLLAATDSNEDGTVQIFADEATARAALGAGTIAGYYRLPADYLSGGTVVWVGDGLGGPQGQAAVEALLRAALLPAEPELAARLATPPDLRFVPTTNGGEAPEPEPGGGEARGPVAFLLPYAFAMILYVTIFTAASYLLQSVTEEKENRTIEIVLTSLRPLELLAGKVLGLGLLGLLQVAMWLGAGLLLLRLSGAVLPADAIGAVPWVAVALAIVYFALGYLVYGSLLAAVGATVTNVREGSQLVLLLVVPCIVPLWFLSAIIAQPNGLLATALSLFPLTAPITMMIRVPLTPIAAWEIAVSLAVLAASAGLCLWLAARLFRAGALLAGQRLSARAVLRALRAG